MQNEAFSLFLPFSPPSSIYHSPLSHTRGYTQPKALGKKKNKRKKRRKLWRLLCFLGGIVSLTSKRVKVATEDTSVISVKSHNFRLLSQDGNTAHFLTPVCDLCQKKKKEKVFKTSTTWPWSIKALLKPTDFLLQSHLVVQRQPPQNALRGILPLDASHIGRIRF